MALKNIVNLFKLIILCFVVHSGNIHADIIYLHADFQGSIVAESNEVGKLVNSRHYSAYGEQLESSKSGVGYTGHVHDNDLNLTYMQARYYDPVIGRFYSNDPMRALAHLSKGNIHGFGRYTYANNNPYKYTDPTGKVAVCFTPVTAPVCVGAVEAAVNGIGALILGGIVIYDELTDDEICTGTFGCSGSNKGKKGKELRGGKKKDRDRWGKYSGKKYKKFQKWWEKEKQKDGSLHDLETDKERDEAYEDYLNDQEDRNAKE